MFTPPDAGKWAGLLAARGLATLKETDQSPPESPISRTVHEAEIGGWQITVILCRYDGPMQFFPTRPHAEPITPPASISLREIESTILEACPAEPVTLKRLASLSGYSYNQYFREAVESLVQKRLLSRCARGVSRLPR